jgi:hypothetical protein
LPRPSLTSPRLSARVLAAFPSIVGNGKGAPRPRHGVRHFVETSGRPVFAARRLDPDKLKIAQAEFRSLEAAGSARRFNSPWSSPLHMVPKQDGSWRPYGDYRRLNTVTKPDRYPLPSMLDLSAAKLHGCKFFSCFYLVKGYHQIPMAAEDVEKTAIVTPFGLFEYLFMPIRLTNAAQSFQRLMDKLFRHLPFVFTYLARPSHRQQDSGRTFVAPLQQFFQVLQENGFTIMNELVGVGVGDSIASLENLPNTFCKKIRETLKSVRAIFDVFSRYRSIPGEHM